MHPNLRRILPVVLILATAAVLYWLYRGSAQAQTNELQASGTVEAVEYVVAPETNGRVIEVSAEEGQAVTAGQTLVALDPALLRAQRAQAEAAYNAALGTARAAALNQALLESGPTPEQLAVAQTVVDRAQLAVDALQDQYDDLSDAARESAAGQQLAGQLDQARAILDNAQAQYDVVKAGANPRQIEAAGAQADAAEAQAQAASAALAVIDVQLSKLAIGAPSDGTVLSRAVEPGAVVLPGATLLVIADLRRLEITVYVPEDRYGTIALGQAASVAVDSFPGQTFAASVVHIADRAEFTPRNVQTADGRKTTVFAIKLAIDNPDGQLKPGMPADVRFEN
jgi:multidrug resistance efflux pump